MSELEIPKDWAFTKIEDIEDKTHPYPIGDGDHGQIRPSDYVREGIPYIRVRDIVENKIVFDNLIYIPNEIHEKNKKSHLFPGDILIAKTGATIGKVAIISDEIKESNTTSSVGKITVNTSKINPKFLYYFIQSKDFKKQMWSVSHKSAQPGFGISNLKNFIIPLPSLDVQELIIKKFDRILIALEKKRKIIKDTVQRNTQKNFVTSIHQEILKNAFSGKLTKFEKYDDLFPQFDELKLDSALKTHALPKHWKWIPIRFVCDGIVPGRYKPTDFSGNIPWITTPDLSELYIEKSKKMLGLTKDEVKKVNMKIMPKGTVLMTCVGQVGTIAITKNEIVPNQQLHGFVPHDTTSSLYIAYALLSQKKQIESLATKTTLPYLNKTKCNGILIPICSIQEQERVISAITDLFAKMNNFEKSRNQIFKLQKSIIHNIDLLKDRVLLDGFSGRLDH